jgi:NAD(P)-dependent dehydrogenase (short-subunit alcohol dehydrogenase family)
MKLKEKVAIVTGDSSGSGRATAVAMAKEGAKVAITARRAERCQEAVEEIKNWAAKPWPYRAMCLNPRT